MSKDFFGTKINVGDFVITAATQYRSGVLRVGIVEDIGMRKPSGYHNHNEVETITIKRLTTNSAKFVDPEKPTTRRYRTTRSDNMIVIQSNLLSKDDKVVRALEKIRETIFKDMA